MDPLQLGEEIAALIRSGNKAAREDYREAGLKLIEARKQYSKKAFDAFLKKYCHGLRPRAYELIAIAKGTTSQDALNFEAEPEMAFGGFEFAVDTYYPDMDDATRKKATYATEKAKNLAALSTKEREVEDERQRGITSLLERERTKRR